MSCVVMMVTRRFDASPERVFDAWLDPDMMRKFFFTSDPSLGYSEGQDVRNDPRVGGTYRVMDRRNGVEYVADGEYLEIDRPRRLVFTFRMAQFSDSFDRVVVEIAPLQGGCQLTLTQEIVMPHAWLQSVMGKTDPLTPQEIEVGLTQLASKTEKGWSAMLDGLARALA
jgi:uncharacterized protein YndB with AHSA1/START domain